MLCLAILVVACSTNVHPQPGGPRFDHDDFRFRAPTGWFGRFSTEEPSGRQRVAYLANQTLHDDCVPDARLMGQICDWPIDGGLRPGGILVTWIEQTCVARSCALPDEPLLAIGNRVGVLLPPDGGCEGLNYTDRFAYMVTVSPQRVDVLLACARDPSDATREAFLGFLDGIQWRVP